MRKSEIIVSILKIIKYFFGIYSKELLNFRFAMVLYSVLMVSMNHNANYVNVIQDI